MPSVKWQPSCLGIKCGINDSDFHLSHWGRVTHICGSKLSILGSDNGLSPGRRHAINLTNAGILLIWPLGTNFSEILIEINTFSFKKRRLKVSSAKWRPFYLSLNVLRSMMPQGMTKPQLVKIRKFWQIIGSPGDQLVNRSQTDSLTGQISIPNKN